MITTSLPPAASADHLTTALRKAGVLGEASVRDVAIERCYDTVLSHICRLTLSYDGGAAGAPEFLILKTGYCASRPGGPAWKAGRQEVAFYTRSGRVTPAQLVPRCYDAHWNAETNAWHLLLEDLTATRTSLPHGWPAAADARRNARRIIETRGARSCRVVGQFAYWALASAHGADGAEIERRLQEFARTIGPDLPIASATGLPGRASRSLRVGCSMRRRVCRQRLSVAPQHDGQPGRRRMPGTVCYRRRHRG